MRRNKTCRYLIAGLCVLLSVLLCGTCVYLLMYKRQLDGQKRQRIEELNKQAKELREEYGQISDELVKTQDMYRSLKLQGSRMTMLIFDQCYSNLYDRVYETMKDKSASGVFVVSENCMIGTEGCITVEQCRELIGNGWCPAVRAPGDGVDFSAYLSQLRTKFEELQIEFPNAFYFPDGIFKKEIFDAAVEYGFTTIFYSVNADLSSVSFSAMSDENSLMGAAYMYASRETTIWENYSKRLLDGENCSIATGKAIDGSQLMEPDRQNLDTTVGNLKDIADTVTAEFKYYRSFAQYRAERLEADIEYTRRKEEIEHQIQDLLSRRERLYEQLLALYTS